MSSCNHIIAAGCSPLNDVVTAQPNECTTGGLFKPAPEWRTYCLYVLISAYKLSQDLDLYFCLASLNLCWVYSLLDSLILVLSMSSGYILDLPWSLAMTAIIVWILGYPFAHKHISSQHCLISLLPPTDDYFRESDGAHQSGGKWMNKGGVLYTPQPG